MFATKIDNRKDYISVSIGTEEGGGERGGKGGGERRGGKERGGGGFHLYISYIEYQGSPQLFLLLRTCLRPRSFFCSPHADSGRPIPTCRTPMHCKMDDNL